MQWWKKNTIPLFKRTFTAFGNDECSRLAASLAYYAVFSIFPLMLLLISVLGFWLRFQGDAASAIDPMQQIISAIRVNISYAMADSLTPILADIKLQAGSSVSLALITTLLAASGIFVQLDNAFDTIWNVPPPQNEGLVTTIRHRLIERGKAFVMVLAIGALLIASLILTTVLNGVKTYATDLPAGNTLWLWLSFIISFVVNIMVFAALFYFLPKPDVRWRNVLPAAVLTAVLWEIGKQLLSLYLGNNRYTASATVTAFIALLAWIYYASMIIFFGAEFSQAYTLLRREQKEAAALMQLPPPPDLPAVGMRGPELVQRQKTAYATAGLIVGVLAAVVMAVLGTLGAAIAALRRLLR